MYKFGKKYIYQLDVMRYRVNAILLAITGVFPFRIFNRVRAIMWNALVGMAIGADVPTSWSLITEFSPKDYRPKLKMLTTIMR